MFRRNQSLSSMLARLTLWVCAALLAEAQAQPFNPDVYRHLRYRFIGPVGNRVISLAGVPGDPNVYYVGAASGGIFKTTDGGIHWEAIFDDQPVSSIGSLAVAPSDPNIVWAGTGETFIRSNISLGNGIYRSTDGGKTWAHMGLERTGRIGRVVIDPRDPDIVFAAAMGHSHGPQEERGVFRTTDGAFIHYYLKSAPEEEVKITILNDQGETVRSLGGTKEAGINRIFWDLRSEETKEIRLRTPPLHAPWVKLGDEGYRTRGPRFSILEPPGTYTVKLTVDGQELSQKLEVRKDPHSEGTEADIEAQVTTLRELREALNTTVDTIHRIEWTRKQLYDLKGVLKEDDNAQPVLDAADELDKKLIAVEEHLHQMKVTGRGQDVIRWPVQLASKIAYLANGVAHYDFPPTSQQLAVQEALQEQMGTYQGQLEELLSKDLAAFNNLLEERGIENIIVR